MRSAPICFADRPDPAREDVVRPYIERGELVSVLEEFSTSFPGFYLYYPARRHALRALIDYLLQLRQSR